MTIYLDSSILVAALVEDEPAHEACLELLGRKQIVAWTHAIAETFATLTGGRLGIRLAPAIASRLIEASLAPRLSWVEIRPRDMLAAVDTAHSLGVRGGAVFDFLHLIAARKANAETVWTLNARHFRPLARKGDPKIEHPS